jgi:hypothetical protein
MKVFFYVVFVLGICNQGFATTLIMPFDYFKAVTKSDTSLLTTVSGVNVKTRAIMAGTTGNIAIKDKAGNTVVINKLAAGVVYPIVTNQVLSTSTTAADITAFW